jgi:hypothetical protein
LTSLRQPPAIHSLLILETKDWRLETIKKATKQYWEIAPAHRQGSVCYGRKQPYAC